LLTEAAFACGGVPASYIYVKPNISMVKKIEYPTKHSVIYTNEIINIMSNRKADQHKLLRPDSFIDIIIKKSQDIKGDLYDKAAILLFNLVTMHGFASGNKRTGFITTLHFITQNGGRIRVKNFNKAERIIRNIRKFETDEIAVWLRTGGIDETKL